MTEDDARLTEIYHELSDDVYKYLYYMLKEPWTAEDLTQETFIRVLRHLEGFTEEASVKTWVFKIARNVALDHLKRKKLLQFFHIEPLFKSLKAADAPLLDGLIMSEEVAAVGGSRRRQPAHRSARYCPGVLAFERRPNGAGGSCFSGCGNQ